MAAKFLAPVTVFVAGTVLFRHTGGPWLVAVGMVALLWVTVSSGLGCPGQACQVPPGYEHWRNIKVAVDVGISGPRVLFSSDTGSCAFDCPYVIQLVPLAIGYVAYADALTSHD